MLKGLERDNLLLRLILKSYCAHIATTSLTNLDNTATTPYHRASASASNFANHSNY